MILFRTIIFALFLCIIAQFSASAEVKLPTEVKSFFETYCYRCHDAKKQKGKFRLDNLARDFGDEFVAEHWAEVLLRINAGEMPPEDEKQPSSEDVGKVAEWISTTSTKA